MSLTSNTGLQTTVTSEQNDSSSDPQIRLESSQSDNQTNTIKLMGNQNECPICWKCPTCTDPYNVCPDKLFITQENPESVYIPQECPKQENPESVYIPQECPKQENTSSWKISVYILGGLLFLCVIVVLLLLRKKKGQQ